MEQIQFATNRAPPPLNRVGLIHVFVSGQLLSYLIVIDFESTCWENKKGFQEISKSVDE